MKSPRPQSILLILGALGLMGVSSCRPESVEISFFHTNDIHSRLRAAKTDPFGLGGVARISTLLKRLRSQAQISLTVDAGDWSEGSWYYSVDSGTNLLNILGAMKYDVTAVGNHDFLAGPDQMISTVSNEKYPLPVLAANLDAGEYPQKAAFEKAFPPTFIKTVGTGKAQIKIGFIGLTTYELFYDAYLAPVRILEPLAVATKLAKQLRPQVDVLVLISHNTFDLNLELARAVPGLDAVISGHSHHKAPQAILVTNAGKQVPVVETGCWGQFLGDLKLKWTPKSKQVSFANYTLHPIDSSIEEDPEIAALVANEDKRLAEKMGDDPFRIVASSELELQQRDALESTLGNLTVKAYRAKTGADLSMEEISLTGLSMPKGPLTLMDLHDVVPHTFDEKTNREWQLKIWTVKGSDLSLAFTVFYTLSGLMPLSSPTGWLSADNVDLTWVPGGSAIRSIKIGGEPLNRDKKYRVAISDGLWLAITLANQKLHLGIDLSQMETSNIEAWRAVADYAASLGTIRKSDVRVGQASRILGPDLAVFYYGMEWNGQELTVEVENIGTAAAGAGILSCFAGIIDAPTLYETEYQKWQLIGQKEIAPLDAGGAVSLTIPWSPDHTGTNHRIPVQCTVELLGIRELYTANNEAHRVFSTLFTTP
ncbi:metallophosphoesterase [Bdellovibrionota bacterium FG-2]